MTEQERFEQWYRETIGEPYCVAHDFWRVGVDYAWAAWKAARNQCTKEIGRKDDALRYIIESWDCPEVVVFAARNALSSEEAE